MKKRRQELAVEKGNSEKLEDSVFVAGGAQGQRPVKPFASGATTEGVPGRRPFQKHVCCVGDSHSQYLWNTKPA